MIIGFIWSSFDIHRRTRHRPFSTPPVCSTAKGIASLHEPSVWMPQLEENSPLPRGIFDTFIGKDWSSSLKESSTREVFQSDTELMFRTVLMMFHWLPPLFWCIFILESIFLREMLFRPLDGVDVGVLAWHGCSGREIQGSAGTLPPSRGITPVSNRQ